MGLCCVEILFNFDKLCNCLHTYLACVVFSHTMISIGAEYYLPLYFKSVRQALPLRNGVLSLLTMVATATVDILTGILMCRTGRYGGSYGLE